MAQLENTTILLDVNFPEMFNTLFLKHNDILKGKGVNMTKPKLIVFDSPDFDTLNITSRNFSSPYLDEDDKIGGNLYKWIHQSYHVLWDANAKKNEIVIYNKTIQKLGLRFATLLKMDKGSANTSISNLCVVFALGDLCWNQNFEDKFNTDSSIDNNNNKLKKEFVFGLAKLTFINDENSTQLFYRFLKMFDKDVDVSKCTIKNDGKTFTINS